MDEVRSEKGFEELEHTADVALRVWAPDLFGLFEMASIGMFTLLESQVDSGVVREAIFSLPGNSEHEVEMVSLLNELLYQSESQKLHFIAISLDRFEGYLRVRAIGHPIRERGKDIKAVTFSDLGIGRTETGLETRVVFDV